MAIDIGPSEPVTREKRLGSIIGYDGTMKDLSEKACSGCAGNKDRCFSTVNYCSHMTAISSVLALDGTLVVDHAPIGCSGVYMIFGGAYDLNIPGTGGVFRKQTQMVTTKLSETDTVFGAEEKLANIVRAAYKRHQPKEIYIATSCTSAIIGEDVASVALKLSAELGIQVTPLSATGMRSRLWATGFDAYYHAVAKNRIKKNDKKTDSIIYSGFAPVAAEELRPIFERLGLDLILLTGGGTIEEFEKASSAVASFGQCDVEASYILSYLEQEFGVKYFHVHQPNGGIGFERFMRDLGRYIGKEEEAEQIIEEEREKYSERIAQIRPFLEGKKALVALGSGYAFEAVRMFKELGMIPLHAVAYHYDPLIEADGDRNDRTTIADIRELGLDVPASVNNAQQMETYLVIKKYKPDILITRAHGAGGWAAVTGIPCLDMGLGINIIGYRGLYLLASAIKTCLQNTSLFDSLKARYKSPFTEEFESLGPHRFYKEDGGVV